MYRTMLLVQHRFIQKREVLLYSRVIQSSFINRLLKQSAKPFDFKITIALSGYRLPETSQIQ